MYGPEYEIIICKICERNGIELKRYGRNCLSLTYCGTTQYIWSRRFPQNTATASRIIDSKYMCSTVLEANNIPVVKHTILHRSDLEEYTLQGKTNQSICEDILRTYGGVVIKPNDSYEGLNVYACFSPKEIETALFTVFQSKAILAAAPFIKATTEYRIFYLNGEVLLLYKKKLPEVIGDGKMTTEQLIKHSGINKLDYCYDLDLEAIPLKGEHVIVGWKFNLSRGSLPEILKIDNSTQKICDLASAAAKVVNARFVTIDLLEEHLTRNLKILEINAGVAMDQFILKHPQGHEIAYEIYTKAIKNMFGIQP